MHVRSRKYRADADFQRVREFLIETYGITKQPFNWTLERWDYCRSFVNLIRDRDPQQWEDLVRVWESGSGDIVGVACYEGSLGEVDPQVHPDRRDLEDEMMVWAEDRTMAMSATKAGMVAVSSWGKLEVSEIVGS